MKLILALGNPGQQYVGTRHNTGFFVLDAFAKQQGIDWQEKAKFKAYIAETKIGDKKVLLAKPTTFYNLAGEAARAIADFYKIPAEAILVIHDELALPFGTIRTRLEGSDAGNNGIKSLNAHLGQQFARVRIGIANEYLARQDAADFVLQRFTAQEAEQLPAIAQAAIHFIEDFIYEDKEFAHASIKI